MGSSGAKGKVNTIIRCTAEVTVRKSNYPKSTLFPFQPGEFDDHSCSEQSKMSSINGRCKVITTLQKFLCIVSQG